MIDREDAMIRLTDEVAPVFSGLDDAIVGVSLTGPTRAVYSYDKLIEVQMRVTGMSCEEAIEWIEDTMSAYVGPQTPLVIDLIDNEC